jgi:hypothetical protein
MLGQQDLAAKDARETSMEKLLTRKMRDRHKAERRYPETRKDRDWLFREDLNRFVQEESKANLGISKVVNVARKSGAGGGNSGATVGQLEGRSSRTRSLVIGPEVMFSLPLLIFFSLQAIPALIVVVGTKIRAPTKRGREWGRGNGKRGYQGKQGNSSKEGDSSYKPKTTANAGHSVHP